MNIEEIELKSCPFCGGEAVIETMTVRKGYEAVIHCNGFCLAEIHTITFDTEEDAIKSVITDWNNRSDAEVKRLTAELEKEKREKEQAIKDLTFACGNQPSASDECSICDICKHKNNDGTCNRQCFMNSLGAINRWEYRGLKGE